MTAFPRRKFDSEICSFGKCAWPYEEGVQEMYVYGKERKYAQSSDPWGSAAQGSQKPSQGRGRTG